MDAHLANLSKLSQKEKAPAYLSLLTEIFNKPESPSLAADLHSITQFVVNDDGAGLVVGRQVLSELVKRTGDGTVKDNEVRRKVVEDALETIQPKIVSYEEQVNVLRFQLADILELDEEWSSAARVLMGISMDSGSASRAVPDSQKLQTYVRIVRLLLEDEDSVQAETYYNRAALLFSPSVASTDRETALNFKLCQARIFDYARKFLEAAVRYHELSWMSDVEVDERGFILAAAVTCAVLAPAGPQRSRILAALYRDERVAELPTYNVLSKMFLDHVIRPAEIAEFEKGLKAHQLAKIAVSSNDRLASQFGDDEEDEGASKRTGPSTVLDRAVMEHNLLAASKVYNNVSFRGLGTLLDLAPSAAETMARKMIEQGRLRGHIDQVERLIWFDVGDEEDAQGKAGGLGDVEQETEDTGAPFTKKWDMQIRLTAANVESVVQHLTDKGLLATPAVSSTA